MDVSDIFSDADLERIVTAILDSRRVPAVFEKRFREWLPTSEKQGFGEIHGTLAPPVPDTIKDVDLLEEHVSEERLDELSGGAKPTPEELSLYQAVWIKWMLEEPDYDICSGFRIYEVTDKRRRTIHALV